LIENLVLKHVVLSVKILQVVHMVDVKEFRFVFGKLASIAHQSEREVQILAFHAHPISLSFRELPFLLLNSPLCFRKRDCIRLQISIEGTWNLLVLRQVSWERLRISIELLLLILRREIVKVVHVCVHTVVHIVVHSPHHGELIQVHIIDIVSMHEHVILVEVISEGIVFLLLLLNGSVEEVVVIANVDVVRVVIDFDFVFVVGVGFSWKFVGILPREEVILAEVEGLFIFVGGRDKVDDRLFAFLVEVVCIYSEMFVVSYVDRRNQVRDVVPLFALDFVQLKVKDVTAYPGNH